MTIRGASHNEILAIYGRILYPEFIILNGEKQMRSQMFNLRLKFITGLVLFALALGICITVIIYFHFNSIMKSEISQRSRMLLSMSTAVQDYVETELRPAMFRILPKGRFVLKAMSSSYISRQIMDRLNIRNTSRYYYRRVSINPKNPDSRANLFEAGLIRLFNNNKNLKIWENNSMVGDREYNLIARPVIFTDSCMQCHGIPGNAPKGLIDIYGDTNGFYFKPNEVGAVVVAGFPVDMIKTPVMNVTLNYLGFYLLGIMLFAGLIRLKISRPFQICDFKTICCNRFLRGYQILCF